MKYLLLALAIGALLRIPGCFTQEQLQRWGLFEADEEQHMAIAVDRYNELAGPDGAIPDPFEFGNFNVQGYGRVSAYVLYGWHLVTGRLPDFATIIYTNRGLAITFSLLLIIVVYFLGRTLRLSATYAGVAALLVASCDLLISYGHYGLPLSGYVLFVYLSLLGGCRLLRGADPVGMVLLALGAAGALAFKFDGFVAAWGGLLLLYTTTIRHKRAYRLPLYYLPLALGLGLLFLWLLTYGWSWEEIHFSFEELRRENADVVERDDHLRDNLAVYPLMVLAGIGLPACALASYGILRTRPRPGVLYIGGLLLTEFVLLWVLDTTFVRRAAVFMPAVALLAAAALARLRPRPIWTAGVVAWSLGLALTGQYNHWYDTRYAFRDWAKEVLPPPVRIGTAGIAVGGLSNTRYYEGAPLDYFAVHESIAGRYTRSATTPFGVPDCCAEVYHCGPEARCRYVQDILLDKHASFELAREFAPLDVFPERLLYAALFGYYETFLGYVRVYRRVQPQRNTYPLS